VSTATFPSTLKGLEWPLPRVEIWQTRTQQSVSGKRLNIADWSQPKHRWEASFSVLRASTLYNEFQTLLGFVNARQGGFDSFLYNCPYDNSSSGSTIGTGDSTDVTFQLVRTMPGTTVSETIYAPTTVSSVFVGGTLMSSTKWSVSNWGSTSPGVITFSTTSIPPSAQAVTADFQFAWPCSFDQDEFSFEEFVSRFMALKKCTFTSIK
jgi:uncharacterized protein (TIGR02217 family)